MRRNMSTIYIIAAVVLIVVFGLWAGIPLQWRWLLIMATVVGLLAFAGLEITATPMSDDPADNRRKLGRIDGLLIDPRNKISLSRLQMALWSVVVLSAWATFALHRIIPVLQGNSPASSIQIVQEVAKLLAGEKTPGEAEIRRATAMLERITGAEILPTGEERSGTDALYDPLDINIPQEVWMALGISIASLTGAGIIKTNKATDDAGKAREVATTRADNAKARTDRIGVLEGEKSSMLETMSGGLESIDNAQLTPAARAAAQAE